MTTVSVGGITVGYDDEGTGPSLVLIHGHPFDRSMWGPQISQFTSLGWRVIAPDLRGYGESSVIPGSVAWSTFARDIGALLDQLKVGTVVLGGLSMGGQIVMEFHRLFPSRVRALMLADTSCHAETEDGRRARHDQADRLLREGMRGYSDEVLPRMVAPGTITALPAVAAHVMAMMLRTSPVGAAAALRARADRPDYADLLARTSVPVLVVVGREDGFTPVADAESMAGRIPNATLAVIDQAAHLPNLERPASFNQALHAAPLW
ncbi:MAG: alpha/beta fold hydrolase [Pseudonocardiaceae bacterium]